MTRGELVAWMQEAVGRLLALPVADVDPQRPLTELGLSSRDALALVAELEDQLGRRVDPTVVWRTPTIDALAEHLLTTPAVVPATDERTTTPLPRPRVSGSAAPATSVGAGTALTTSDEPVAVVGVGCRLPGGVDGPQAFWQQLLSGRDSTSEVPAGRWEQFPQPNAAGRAAVADVPRRGGFLADVAAFDADHFGITPREAALVDPQQRMLLEVAWEALVHAGVEPASLAGTATGVWVGLSTNEYGQLTLADSAVVDAWAATGAALSVAANRLSYLLDLRGPSMTVDTACSSSLVAVHEAVRSLRSGEVRTAIVGGANVLLSPNVTAAFHSGGVLAADGRCKPFGATADGIVRAEAVGAVVFKRLSDALADGDRVLAVVRGSGVNSDGRSNGLMAPNPAAQEDLLRDVYSRCGIDPAGVDYVEAHGTGTLLGDPIEAQALGTVLGAGREPGRPLLIGSVKSNLGHAEAAAGIVALVKTVLALANRMLPPSLGATERNPHIRFEEQGLDVVTRLRPWPRYSGTARAGVSAFGFGGTNAHVVLEEWRDAAALPAKPGQPGRTGASDDVVTAVVTGTDDTRVADAAAALADHLAASPKAVLPDVAHTLARRRRHGGRRAVAVGRGRAGLVEALRALAEGREAVGVVPGHSARPTAPEPGAVWVFSGYGSQWAGMARELLDDEPAFAAAVDELTPLLLEASGIDLRAVVRGEVAPGVELGVAQSQVAIFGVQVALAATWRAHGHEPAAVLGQSLGEVAAAVVAGALSLADGVTVIAERSRLLEEVSRLGGGAMAVLELSGTEFEGLAARFPDVVVAVHASPRQSTVAGDGTQVLALAEHVESLGRQAWVLPVTGAGHSPAVEPILPELGRVLAGITPTTPTVPLYSTVHADPRRTPECDAAYWQANARGAVRFAQAVSAAAADGHRTFLEVSPHPVAVPAIGATLTAAGTADPLVLGSLRRGTDSGVTFRTQLAVLAGRPGYRAVGTARDPEGLGVPLARHADLPRPVWRHLRHWAEPVRRSRSGAAHPLLGTPVRLPGRGRHAFAGDAGLADLPWLADHAVHGTPVLPAAGFAEIVLAAGAHALGRSGHEVEVDDLELHRLLVCTATTPLTTTVEPVGAGDRAGRRPRGHRDRRPRALRDGDGAGRDGRRRRPRRRGHRPRRRDDARGRLRGVRRGRPPVRPRVQRGGRGRSPSPTGGQSPAWALPREATADEALTVHPALLDACLQALAPAVLATGDPGVPGVPHLPFAVGSLGVPGDPQRGGWCTARVATTPGGLVGEVTLRADDSTLLLVARDVILRPLGRESVAVPLADKAFELVWADADEVAQPGTSRWHVVGEGPLADAARSVLGDRVTAEAATATLLVCDGPGGARGEEHLLRLAATARDLEAARESGAGRPPGRAGAR